MLAQAPVVISHTNVMTSMTNQQKRDYCLDQALNATDRDTSIGWMTHMKTYERMTALVVTVDGSGFAG